MCVCVSVCVGVYVSACVPVSVCGCVMFPSLCVVVGLYVCVFQEMASWNPKAADWPAPSLIGALTPPSQQLSLQLPTSSPA